MVKTVQEVTGKHLCLTEISHIINHNGAVVSTPNSNRVWGSNLGSGRPASYPGLILDKILDKRIRGDRWDWLQQTQVWRKQVQMRTD